MHQLRAFSKTLEEVTEDTNTLDSNEEPYPLSRLADGLAIGHNNGDIMYLDPEDDHAVWLFHLDGGDVERLASSFEEWLANAEPE